ncbi:hypothetical protein G7Y89_g6626 [Cudoniella acicularis]|uniref:DUF7791 domain-containing protein n=1 Tax=Cudoniella acicularis TaxID=354080 RepID=A0A8H4W2U5_9HELO|nr:hypothetical protein G7Y89_g6626 [Cudoniella acicularis]
MAIPYTWRRVSCLTSACYDGFYVQNGSINGDHNSMCKFSDSSNVGYKRTSGHINRLVRKLSRRQRLPAKKVRWKAIPNGELCTLNLMETHRQGRKAQEGKVEDAILSALFFRAISHRKGDISPPFARTFQWIPRKSFIPDKPKSGLSEWLSSNKDRLYCISGKAGSGKSTMMKMLSDGEEVRTPMGLWEDGFTLAETSKAFLLLVQQEQVPVSACCFIDGLDEHEGGDRDILEILMELCCANSPDSQLKLTCAFEMCVSARPHNAFEVIFERCPGIRIHEHTKRGIALYTYGRLQAATPTTFPSAQAESQELWKIADKIVQESSGIFLWVRLAVESLLDGLENKDFAHQLRQRVRLLPKDLEEFYKQIIRSIPDLYRQEAFHIFKIVLDSPQHFKQIRMLCYTTVEVATLAENHDKYFGETWGKEAAKMATRLKSVCGGLLEMVEDEMNPAYSLVQFIHQTAKDYIQHPSLWNFLVGINDTAFNFDLFLEFQLYLYQENVIALTHPEEESDQLSLYIPRAEKTRVTFDYYSGDCGYIPKAMTHYVENVGTDDVVLIKVGLTPPQIVMDTLNLTNSTVSQFKKEKQYIVPGAVVA